MFQPAQSFIWLFSGNRISLLGRARQIGWQQGELKFKAERTENVFSLAEGESVAVGMPAMLMSRQEMIYMGQHTAVHVR